jgi:hypothetical protein
MFTALVEATTWNQALIASGKRSADGIDAYTLVVIALFDMESHAVVRHQTTTNPSSVQPSVV